MERIYLHFDKISVREANEKAADLQSLIKKATGEKLIILKEKTNTQDAGSIIEIVLASKAIIDIAKGIAIWLKRNSGISFTYRDETGKEINVKNLDSVDKNTGDLLKNILS